MNSFIDGILLINCSISCGTGGSKLFGYIWISFRLLRWHKCPDWREWCRQNNNLKMIYACAMLIDKVDVLSIEEWNQHDEYGKYPFVKVKQGE